MDYVQTKPDTQIVMKSNMSRGPVKFTIPWIILHHADLVLSSFHFLRLQASWWSHAHPGCQGRVSLNLQTAIADVGFQAV